MSPDVVNYIKRLFYNSMLTNLLKILFILIFLTGCKSTGEKNVVKKKRLDPNLDNRITQRVEEGGGLFGNIAKGGNTFQFSTSNPLWRASLQELDFVPMASVNYSGGIIVSDWYSNSLSSKDSIKIEVRFLSSEVKASSVKVLTYRKICNENNNCKINKGSESFNKKIHEAILETAKVLQIEDKERKRKK